MARKSSISARYEKLKSKGKSARISNISRKKAGKRAGRAGNYNDWTKQDLYDRAKKVGIKNYSTKNKRQLINALRNH